jgi:hypothetical protein
MANNDDIIFDEQWFPKDRRPWERLPGESDKAYAAFQAYLGIEPAHERTIAEACAKFYGRPVSHYNGPSQPIPQNIKTWKREYMWDTRCEAHDFWRTRDQMEAVRHARIEKAREEGFELAEVEKMTFDNFVALHDKIMQAVKNLPIQNPLWRDINAAMKVANEIAVNFYKISKWKHDMKDQDSFGGLSEEQMRDFWEKKPPKERAREGMAELANAEEEE